MKDKIKQLKISAKDKLQIAELSDSEKLKINKEFINEIAPLGGIDFTDCAYTRTGTGYEACLYIYGYPKQVQSFWLQELTSFPETITVIDIASINKNAVITNLSKSLDEQGSRMRNAKNESEYRESRDIYAQLEMMYDEIKSFDEVMKVICIRLYIPAKTRKDLENKIREINESLSASYKVGICLHETKNDYLNVLRPYKKQQKNIYARKGQPILSSVIALGNPFHFNSLQDPRGAYFGKTQTGGCVFLDMFHKTDRRMAYNFLIAGKSGSGKSTALKKIILERIIRGDKVRIFDVEGDFENLVNYLGGKTIYLDGTGKHIVNMFHIFPDETLQTAYAKHIAKMVTIYKYLKKEATEDELLIFKKLLNGIYLGCGIIDKEGNVIKDLNNMLPNEFPKASDFVAFVKSALTENKLSILGIREEHKELVLKIELMFDDICSTYKHIFDGYTSSENLYDEQLVCYNMVSLRAMEDKVFDAQLFSTMTSVWADFIVSGKEQKELFEKKILPFENVKHSLMILDESHISINANKTAAINELSEMFRQGRKYFAGIGLASQRISDFVPDNSDSKDVERIKALFGLTDYRFLMKQDESDIPKLKSVFGEGLTERELAKIPEFTTGKCILQISGDRNIEIEDIYVPQSELDIFSGGA